MKKCGEEDRQKIYEYVSIEPEMNLFVYGNIENFGMSSKQIELFVNEKDGQWDSLLMRYYNNYLIYSRKTEYEIAPIINELRNREVESISGKTELIKRLMPFYEDYVLKETCMMRCNKKPEEELEFENEVKIRKLTIHDIPTMISLYCKIDEFSKEYVGKEKIKSEQIRENMEKGSICVGAFKGAKLVAVAGSSAANSVCAMVTGVATEENYRRKGYAKAVVIHLIQEMFLQGKKFICLFYENPVAGELYKSIGFQEIGAYAMLQQKEKKKKEPDITPYKFKHMKWTDTYEGYKIRPGFFSENGAMVVPGGVNFTVFSKNATSCELLLFRRREKEPYVVIPFPSSYRIGYVYSMIVFDLDISEFEYAYHFDGPYNPKKGLVFDKQKVLLDPYAKAVTGQSVWGVKPEHGSSYHARVVEDEFDWDDSKQPEIPMSDLVIYELHVRGFTRHESSNTACPGTFAGVMEKIPYLKQLGINAVELMPIFEFDEMKDCRMVNGKQLVDYWGYNPVCFFAPNTSYTSSLEYNHEGNELKTLIKELNKNGIEVILDVVFNHTAEGNEYGPYISYKGIDNNVYYLLTPDGYYYNFSGCGNTMNCNHPVVQRMILDCLRYWVTEYRVDGFRFDLASILGRNEDGAPMNNPPLLRSLAFDPILGKVKLIAEAWDAGGLYQVGSFPSWQRWSEWNGKYRDDIRKFLKGDDNLEWVAANRMLGSLDIYDPALRGTSASVNFITCHDGFTLWDLYSYNQKHNEENGWDNQDGDNNNNSWNCGVEGETENPDILALRKKLVKNACVVLFASRGIPMFLAGDEFGNTQFGNNNAYCQDNEISWLDWRLLNTNHDIHKFFMFMIRFRKEHPILRYDTKESSLRLPLTSLHGLTPWKHDPAEDHHYVGILYAGRKKREKDDYIYIAVNTYWEPRTLNLPKLSDGYLWYRCLDTDDNIVNGLNQVTGPVTIKERTVMIFVAYESVYQEKGKNE